MRTSILALLACFVGMGCAHLDEGKFKRLANEGARDTQVSDATCARLAEASLALTDGPDRTFWDASRARTVSRELSEASLSCWQVRKLVDEGALTGADRMALGKLPGTWARSYTAGCRQLGLVCGGKGAVSGE